MSSESDSFIYEDNFTEKNEIFLDESLEVANEVTIESFADVIESSTHNNTDQQLITNTDRPMWKKSQGSRSSSRSNSRSTPRSRSRSRSRSSSPSRLSRSRSRKRSRTPIRRTHRKNQSLSPPPKNPRHRESRSSSRGTFDGFDLVLPVDECPYACRACRRGFYTIRELAEHEIRAHDQEIECTLCEKKSASVAKLAAHIVYRHPSRSVICFYCDEHFGPVAEKLSSKKWDTFREHVYKEVLKKQMYMHSSVRGSAGVNINPCSDSVALRGVGKCPHGPPIRCKNFPSCPGAKCIYAHGKCRYDGTCNKASCPFDHIHRPRTCLTCVADLKDENIRKSRRS